MYVLCLLRVVKFGGMIDSMIGSNPCQLAALALSIIFSSDMCSMRRQWFLPHHS